MQYTMTEQYARGEENVIASFKVLSDAKMFLERKLFEDETARKIIIYRLYDDCELLSMFNKENASVSHAKYADGSADVGIVKFTFHVKVRTITSLPHGIANFNDRNNANLFIFGKAETDNTLDDTALFFIYKNKALLDAVNKTTLFNRRSESKKHSNNTDGATFQPTPLQTIPTPPGTPRICWLEKEEDEPNKNNE